MAYRDLNAAKDEFRLLSLFRTSRSNRAEIEVELETFPLTSSPAYTALSYTWGDPNVTRPIIVDGYLWEVTLNLEAALRQIRAQLEVGQCRRLWIDALCINQKNIQERNLQVCRMKSIYKIADDVLVWLGPASRGGQSDRAIQFWEYLAEQCTHFAKDDFKDVTGYNETTAMLKQELSNDPTLRHTLSEFANREYWRRVWIIQEVAVARQIIVQCGALTTNFKTLLTGFVFWREVDRMEDSSRSPEMSKDLDARDSCVDSLWQIHDGTRERKSLSLLETLSSTSTSEATNPVDKVFALLGISHDGEDFVPSPRYDLPLLTVFISMTKSAISTMHTLDVALMLCRERQRHYPGLEDRPSWMPIWTGLRGTKIAYNIRYILGYSTLRSGNSQRPFDSRNGNSQRTRFAATLDYQPDVRFRDQILISKGVIIDTVHSMSRTTSQPAKPNKTTIKTKTQNPYVTNREIFHVLWMLFTLFRSVDVPLDEILLSQLWSQKLPVSVRLRTWLDDMAGFAFHGRTFKQWCEDSSRSVWLESLKTKLNDAGTIKLQRLADDLVYLKQLGRQLFLSHEGYVGWAPKAAGEGDVVALLLGCTVPVILSRRSGGGYFLVGPCLVPGFMDGEKLPQDERQYQYISIH
ncbi:hypothetical protein IFR05_002930 [Cadophora sp. M221]|nr:hypothetical protein IFR05_002930 [Cadophora sp. M221]